MSVMGNEFSGLPMNELIGGPLKAACDAQIRLAKATSDFINTVGFNPELGADNQPTGRLVPKQVDFSFWQPLPINPTLKLTGVTINNAGSGYTANPTATFSAPPAGGTLATGDATYDSTSGKVTGVTIKNAGSGYTSAPTVTFTGGGGTGATGTGLVSPDPTITNETQVQKVILSVPFLVIVNVPALMVKSVNITFDMEVKTSETHKDESSQEATLDFAAKAGWGPFSMEIKIHGAVSSHQENTRSTDRSAKYHVEVTARDDGMPEGLSRVLDILQKSIAPVSVSKAATLQGANIGQNQKVVA